MKSSSSGEGGKRELLGIGETLVGRESGEEMLDMLRVDMSGSKEVRVKSGSTRDHGGRGGGKGLSVGIEKGCHRSLFELVLETSEKIA